MAVGWASAFTIATWCSRDGGPRAAHATTTVETDGARALRAEGERLLDRGEVDAACAKLEASRRIAAEIDTLIALASCHERLGKLASAWTGFVEASTVAERDGNAIVARSSSRRASDIEPKVYRIRVRLTDAPDDQSLFIGDRSVSSRSTRETVTFVDPGDVVVRATARGRHPWTTNVHIPRGPGQMEIVIPRLENAPVVDANRLIVGAEFPRKSMGLLVAGLGAAAAITGGALFALGQPHVNTDAHPSLDRSQQGASVPQILGAPMFGAGIVAMGIGTVIALTPKANGLKNTAKQRPRWRILPAYSHGPGVSFGGRF